MIILCIYVFVLSVNISVGFDFLGVVILLINGFLLGDVV